MARPTDPNLVKTIMGWNQVVGIDLEGTGSYQTLRVSDYQMGSKQTGDAPSYVTGLSDRTAWTKGPVEIDGSVTFPYTFDQSGTISGKDMWEKGAELCKDITASFGIKTGTTAAGGVTETVSGCKINSASLSCSAGEPIQVSCDIWGISTDTTNTSSTDEPQLWESGVNYSSGVYASGDNSGQTSLTIVQVPMFDAVTVKGAPDGMYIVGFSIEINNNLQRNYTMGCAEDGFSTTGSIGSTTAYPSPWGLNATSITAGQRTVTGTVTWQSDVEGDLSTIMGSGLGNLEITIQGSSESITLTMINVLWNAAPPSVGSGDRITCESGFTALGSGGISNDGFDALTIT